MSKGESIYFFSNPSEEHRLSPFFPSFGPGRIWGDKNSSTERNPTTPIYSYIWFDSDSFTISYSIFFFFFSTFFLTYSTPFFTSQNLQSYYHLFSSISFVVFHIKKKMWKNTTTHILLLCVEWIYVPIPLHAFHFSE